MHSHDRTLLASLGFADQDKKQQRHDWACQYLTNKDNAANVCAAAFNQFHGMQIGTMHAAITEHPIVKGDGQYKTLIGFADAFYQHYLLDAKDGCRTRACTCAEVKILPVGIGEIIRQVKLYREFITAGGPIAFIVATAFLISEEDRKQLSAVRIAHIRLGPKFDAYCELQQAAGSSAPSESPEI